MTTAAIGMAEQRTVARLVLAMQTSDEAIWKLALADALRDDVQLVAVLAALAHDLAQCTVALAGGNRDGAVALTRATLAKLTE